MNKDTILVWFRNDLRVRDNEILWQALTRADKVVPVYVIDPRQFVPLGNGIRKTGVIRAKFILESIDDLKQSLQQRGADLLVVTGYPEEVLPTLADQYKVKEVYHHREVAKEETDISTRVEEALWRKRLNLRHFIGHTLYHKEDLPFPIKDIPDAFATFRKKIERETSIRPTADTPAKIDVPADLESSEVPDLVHLGFSDEELECVDDALFKGGETEALRQLEVTLRGGESSLANDIGVYDGSILSPWIALGCLSAHTVYHAVREEDRHLPKKRVSAIMSGLLWRDYFRFMFKKHGNKFFLASGLSGDTTEVRELAMDTFERWKKGETGEALVDAAMHQLNTIGFMPNPARILVAHYLVNELGISHLLGAAYFEDKLIDYSPASNYGSWAHVAGLGSSVKDNGVKDVKKIQAQIGSQKEYLERWKTNPLSLTD